MYCYATKIGPKDKFSPRATPNIFMGYPYVQKGYKLYIIDT